MSAIISWLERFNREMENRYDRVCVDDVNAGYFHREKAPIPESAEAVNSRLKRIEEVFRQHKEAGDAMANLFGGVQHDEAFLKALQEEKNYLNQLLIKPTEYFRESHSLGAQKKALEKKE